MNVAHYSDLHLEFQDWEAPETKSDVVILNGDIHVGTKGVEWALAQKSFKSKDVIYVLGNHEYYCHPNTTQLNDALLKLAKNTHVHVLIDDSVVIDGVNFIGSTLWTDYRMGGNESLCMVMATGMLNDHKYISVPTEHMVDRKLSPYDCARMHAMAKDTIVAALSPSMPNVLAVHHGVHPACSHPRHRADSLSGAFNSDLSEWIGCYGDMLSAVVYGHTHYNHDMTIHGVPVYSNQRGYSPHDCTPDFNPKKVFAV